VAEPMNQDRELPPLDDERLAILYRWADVLRAEAITNPRVHEDCRCDVDHPCTGLMYELDRIAEIERMASELKQLCTQLAEIGNAGVQWGVQAAHGDDAFPARTRELAQKLAAEYSRLREPGCRPTPWHVVWRVRTDWQRVEPEADRG